MADYKDNKKGKYISTTNCQGLRKEDRKGNKGPWHDDTMNKHFLVLAESAKFQSQYSNMHYTIILCVAVS